MRLVNLHRLPEKWVWASRRQVEMVGWLDWDESSQHQSGSRGADFQPTGERGRSRAGKLLAEAIKPRR